MIKKSKSNAGFFGALLLGATLGGILPFAAPVPLEAQTGSPGSSAIDTAGYPRAAEIRGNRVNIRTGPSTNHNPITQLPDRTRVAATGRNGEWIRFSLPPEVKVWIAQRFVESSQPGRARVRGNKVNLRAAPNTLHSPIGQALLGTTIFPTGRLDAIDVQNGPWVEIYAPLGTSGWIHSRYLAQGDRLTETQYERFYRSWTPPNIVRVSAPDDGLTITTDPPVTPTIEKPDPTPAIEKKPKLELPFPKVGRDPFVVIYEQLRVEYAKLPTTWNFNPMLTDLRRLERASEDLVIADMARQWIDVIETNWVPYARRMQAHQTELELAAAAAAEAARAELETTVRPDRGTARKDREFLAVGWVATLGKYRKADGTHRLLKGNKLVSYLKSETIKLDDYVNKRVGISGVKQELPPSAGANLILVHKITVLSD